MTWLMFVLPNEGRLKAQRKTAASAAVSSILSGTKPPGKPTRQQTGGESMGRAKRNAAAGFVYHVLDRGNERRVLFHTGADYAAFEHILAETRQRFPVHLLAWCLMPNHWHLVLQPMADGCLSAFMHYLTSTHTRRWQVHREVIGKVTCTKGASKRFWCKRMDISSPSAAMSSEMRWPQVSRRPHRRGAGQACGRWNEAVAHRLWQIRGLCCGRGTGCATSTKCLLRPK
jgi:REP element-mobilizing transposase RayT